MYSQCIHIVLIKSPCAKSTLTLQRFLKRSSHVQIGCKPLGKTDRMSGMPGENGKRQSKHFRLCFTWPVWEIRNKEVRKDKVSTLGWVSGSSLYLACVCVCVCKLHVKYWNIGENNKAKQALLYFTSVVCLKPLLGNKSWDNRPKELDFFAKRQLG